MATKEELKAKRAKAMGVVGAQRAASAAMYDEVIAYGAEVDKARESARTATLGAMDAEIADLKEMADDHAEFAQAANPTPGAKAGIASSPASAPVRTAAVSPALAALQAAQPSIKPEAWGDGNAYHGTEGELIKNEPPTFTHTLTAADIGNIVTRTKS